MKSILQLELDEPINTSLLFKHSPFYSKLLKQHEVKLLDDREDQLFFVLRGTISAEDAMRTIEIFDFDKNYLNKKIIFFENTSGNDWNVAEKNKTDYELKITTSFTTSETLQDTSANDWLESKEIQGILEKNKLVSSVKFNQPLQQCFENNKKHEFHVRTLFCNYLSENLPTNDSLATLDLNNLILHDFGAGVNKLKFKESDKFDFKYLFPVDERDLNKVKIFYRDMEGGEKMISKVVKILDKYFKDLEKEKNIQGKDIETFEIVEKAITKIIETKNKFGDDCQFPDKDYEKIENFSEKCSKFRGDRISNPAIEQKTNERNTKLVRPYKNPPTSKDDEWTLFKPFEDFFQNLLGNSSEKKVNSGQQNERTGERKSPNFPLHTEEKYGSKDEPSSFLQDIIDIICCGSRDNRGR